MKNLILYSSHYGSTKKYAIWINETLNAQIMDIHHCDEEKIMEYDNIILVSNVMHGKLSAQPVLYKYNELFKERLTHIITLSLLAFDDTNLATLFPNTIIMNEKGSFHSSLSLKDHLSIYFHPFYYHQQKELLALLHQGNTTINKDRLTYLMSILLESYQDKRKSKLSN